MTDTLFAYGTLRGEFDNPYTRLLREKGQSLGRATVRGSLFFVGGHDRYPGYRTEPDGIVVGELWRLHDPEATLAALDDYEGPEYSRVAVSLADDPKNKVWIYLYIFDLPADRRIVTGDFLFR